MSNTDFNELLNPQYLETFNRDTVMRNIKRKELRLRYEASFKENSQKSLEDKMKKERGLTLTSRNLSARSKEITNQFSSPMDKQSSISNLLRSVTKNTDLKLEFTSEHQDENLLTGFKSSFKTSSSKITPFQITSRGTPNTNQSSRRLFITNFEKLKTQESATIPGLNPTLDSVTSRQRALEMPISPLHVRRVKKSSSREKIPAARHSSLSKARVLVKFADGKCNFLEEKKIENKPSEKAQTARSRRILFFESSTNQQQAAEILKQSCSDFRKFEEKVMKAKPVLNLTPSLTFGAIKLQIQPQFRVRAEG